MCYCATTLRPGKDFGALFGRRYLLPTGRNGRNLKQCKDKDAVGLYQEPIAECALALPRAEEFDGLVGEWGTTPADDPWSQLLANRRSVTSMTLS